MFSCVGVAVGSFSWLETASGVDDSIDDNRRASPSITTTSLSAPRQPVAVQQNRPIHTLHRIPGPHTDMGDDLIFVSARTRRSGTPFRLVLRTFPQLATRSRHPLLCSTRATRSATPRTRATTTLVSLVRRAHPPESTTKPVMLLLLTTPWTTMVPSRSRTFLVQASDHQFKQFDRETHFFLPSFQPLFSSPCVAYAPSLLFLSLLPPSA